MVMAIGRSPSSPADKAWHPPARQCFNSPVAASMHELPDGLRVAGAFVQLKARAPCVIKYETHVGGAIGLHGAVEEELHQHVLLRMAAAELNHLAQRRPHQRDRA